MAFTRVRRELPREDKQRAQEIKDREWAQSLTDESLVEWLAQIAHEAKRDWGFIKREIMRRIDNTASKDRP